MDKENDENLAREGLLSGIASEDMEQGNSQGFSPRSAPENEPQRVLQLSQAFFVADTLEDDESMIIPPTQEFLIPSTPPPAETSSKEGNTSNRNDDTTLSNLEETFMEEAEKAAEPEVVDICSSQNDMTQDLPELDETQQILVDKAPPPASSTDLEKETQGDDDWDLRFSETQETQELLSSARIRQSKEKEESAKLQEMEDKAKSENLDLNSNDDNFRPTSISNEQPKIPESTAAQESDDEIEPSQSCLAELQGDTYSAFRDQLTQLSMEPPTAHSTPDNTFNGGKPNPEVSDIPVVPSPIVNPNGSALVSEFKESTDGPSIEEKQVSESSMVEPVVEEAPAEIAQTSKELDQSTLVLDLEPTEVQMPVLVEDTQPEEKVVKPSTEDDKSNEKKVDFVVDTIELMSSVDDSVCEIPKDEKKVAEVEFKVPEVMEVSHEEDVKDSKGSIALSEEPEIDACGQSSEDCSEKPKDEGHVVESLPETLPMIMLPPLMSTSRLSRKQPIQRGKKFAQIPAQFEKREKHKTATIGTFNDMKSLQNIFDKFGIVLHNEGSEAMINLRPSEELKVKETLQFTVKDHKVFLERYLEFGSPNAISPISSSSSSSTTTTLHSGEMADISSSLSAKSATFSLTHLDSSTGLSSQEHKTSTQNSTKNSFVNIFESEKKDADESKEKVELSPIKSTEAAEAQSSGRKRGGRKVAAAKPKAVPLPKRKRGRAAAKSKTEEVVAVKESDTSVDVRPRKTRRKEKEDPPVRTPARASADVQEVVTTAEGSGDAYADSPYGSIIPGVRVMARWKDGYYYPGEVVSQEMEGRWSIRFEDEDTRVIPQENLIKIAILERGTSVFAKSQDDYYDPGIVCGHFREGTNVGYEVELDNGVTKRYPRTSVILSTDQAKLITRSRPPTTPATVTINLENIMGGKRKRKSRQSPAPSPIQKKSPRVTRTSKFDPNLAESCTSANEKETSLTTTTENEEESVPKERNTRKRRAAKTGASKTLTQNATKLFKDYAFLLTNAERKKPVSKASTSEDQNTEDEEVVPFDKDELVDYISSRGGTILESFDDVQKCKKKNIYLLANTYLRTMKYIKCIAAGIPCIKHHWVQDCCYKGEILNIISYKLPAGKSLVTNQIVEWHGKDDVLKDVKISLISAAENPFVFNWAPVLLAAKAEFVQKWNLPSSKSGSCLYVDVLITNPQCPTDVLQSAKKRKIPIVSSEWIIQTLIAGKRLPYNAHPKFKYDFVE